MTRPSSPTTNHSATAPATDPATSVDVAIVGGGPAGIAAAVALGRSLRTVTVIDAGQARNAPSAHAHNVLGHEGRSPMEIRAAGRAEAEGYGATFRATSVTDVEGTGSDADPAFTLTLADGATLTARRLLLASGLVDELPAIPGVREGWGRTVLHCPYCHGYEVRGQRVGVLGTSPNSLHQALLFRRLTPHVTLFRHGLELTEEQWEQLAALGVEVVDGEIATLHHPTEDTCAVELATGQRFTLDAAVVGGRMLARGELFTRLGGTMTEHPFGEFIATQDARGATAVPGVYAAGNATDLAAMVIASAAAGMMAGAGINAELVMTDAAGAVAARR
ncbi:NAD(P)/FAD-dependent oxidoreductase [Serinibacter salmoneus]|uniref:Thioredoxin reductase n=1 Tax=Serinibacter salmoneus TaxID=556530 RepID=A0A2A9CWB8_9MICO|nr:NAD(P)/FAD-dependent oxidoreductase [Serinibacter salmoneus]PFG18728.1 thioredoxin reductase [Serinibacter salmoneus]